MSAGNIHFRSNLPARHRAGRVWRMVFQASTVIGLIALATLLLTILNDSFGYVALENKVEPEALTVGDIPLEDLAKEELVRILQENVSGGLFRRLDRDLSFEERSQAEVYDLVLERVVDPQVVNTWTLQASLFNRDEVFAEAADKYPHAKLQFKSWINQDFLTSAQSSLPLTAGVRTALLGPDRFPAGRRRGHLPGRIRHRKRINRLIQTNINNLAGVPFHHLRHVGPGDLCARPGALTSGAALGLVDPTTANGRTILSAGLTLALLVLPLIIINAQEAIRAVPASLRQASYGLGATSGRRSGHHVLPNAIPAS
jgi:phosphate transport system permease protein